MAESRPFLDFKAIKARASITAILGGYGVTLNRVNETTLKGNCPLPSHSSKSKNTFYVNEAKSVWYCHSDSCKKNGDRAGGNGIDLVAAMENLSAYDAAARVQEMFPAPATAAGRGPERNAAPMNPSPPEIAGKNKALGFALKDVNPEHPMIQSRGITIETARAWGIGFYCSKQKTASMDNRIVFPLHEGGHLVGYAGRATQGGQDPKWLLGKGLVKSFLYGLDRCDPAKPLVLVESFWAVPWFYQQGMQAAALMGCEMTAEQEEYLKPFVVITVALDNDAAGNEKAAPIVGRLKAAGHKVLKARLKE